jgi:hypothetical protein
MDKKDKSKFEKALQTMENDCSRFIKSTYSRLLNKKQAKDLLKRWDRLFSSLDIAAALALNLVSLQGLYNEANDPQTKWKVLSVLNSHIAFCKTLGEENFTRLNDGLTMVKEMTLSDIILKEKWP